MLCGIPLSVLLSMLIQGTHMTFLSCRTLSRRMLLYRQLGVVHFATGEYEQARERFGKVLSIVEGLSSQVSYSDTFAFIGTP